LNRKSENLEIHGILWKLEQRYAISLKHAVNFLVA